MVQMMEDRKEALKHELAAATARAEAAEAERTEHLDIARGQVQVLTLALSSLGCKLRDTELDRQGLEARLEEAKQDLTMAQEAKEESASRLQDEMQAELQEAALRLQRAEAAREGVQEDLESAEVDWTL